MGYSSENKEGTGREAAEGEGHQLGVNDSLLISLFSGEGGQGTVN